MTIHLHIRVHPSTHDPSKHELTIVDEGTESPSKEAQDLWDHEQKIQKDMGIEKFRVHAYLMQPVGDEHMGKTLRKRKLLTVEFVDSGRNYIFQMLDGISQWSFKPTLGGIDFGRDENGHNRNLDGFKPIKHPFYSQELVPVTTRTFRRLAALLHMCRPETNMSVCNVFFDYHEHYVINIYLKRPRGNLNTPCTTHILCGDGELENLFQHLCSITAGQNRSITEIGMDSRTVPENSWNYEQCREHSVFVDHCGWPINRIVRFVAYPSRFKPSA